MGFGGSAAAMILSIRNNAKQLTQRPGFFEKSVTSRYRKSTKIYDSKKMSPDKFLVFKQKLKENEIQRQKRTLLVFAGIMLVIIGVILYLLFYL